MTPMSRGEIVRTAIGHQPDGARRRDGATASRARKPIWMRWCSSWRKRSTGMTQPYRYGIYLASHDADEAIAVLQTLAKTGRPQDRAWAYFGWAICRGPDAANRHALCAARLPHWTRTMSLADQQLARRMRNVVRLPEQALRDKQQGLALLAGNGGKVQRKIRLRA